jgi:acyl carrier protein
MLSGEVCQSNRNDVIGLERREVMTAEITQIISTYLTTQILRQPKRILKADEPLLSNGLIDSFSLVDLSLFIEKTFNVYSDNTELSRETFDTLSQLADLIKSRM